MLLTYIKQHILKILKSHISDDLPIDARTLLKTPRTIIIKEVIPEDYYNFGLQNRVINFLIQHDNFSLTETDIEIIINIDGLRISKSSSGQLWPILGSIFPYNHVFMIGLYYGKQSKPNDSNGFCLILLKKLKNCIEIILFMIVKNLTLKLKEFQLMHQLNHLCCIPKVMEDIQVVLSVKLKENILKGEYVSLMKIFG